MRALVITALLLGSCSKKQTDDGDSTNEATAALTLSDFALGDSYVELAKKGPYEKPCDDDPVDKKERQRVIVYGAKPCRDRSFKQGTSLLLFVLRDEAMPATPITAAVWLGGTYFDAQNSLGLKVGKKRDDVQKLLGKPTSSFEVPGRYQLDVDVHSNQRFAIYDEEIAAGYGIGTLPTAVLEDEQHWRAVSQIYRKYTARVGGARISKENCQQMATKMATLMEPHDPALAKRFSSRVDQFIEQCGRELSSDEFTCTMAATTYTELRACARRNR